VCGRTAHAGKTKQNVAGPVAAVLLSHYQPVVRVLDDIDDIEVIRGLRREQHSSPGQVGDLPQGVIES